MLEKGEQINHGRIQTL